MGTFELIEQVKLYTCTLRTLLLPLPTSWPILMGLGFSNPSAQSHQALPVWLCGPKSVKERLVSRPSHSNSHTWRTSQLRACMFDKFHFCGGRPMHPHHHHPAGRRNTRVMSGWANAFTHNFISHIISKRIHCAVLQHPIELHAPWSSQDLSEHNSSLSIYWEINSLQDVTPLSTVLHQIMGASRANNWQLLQAQENVVIRCVRCMPKLVRDVILKQ